MLKPILCAVLILLSLSATGRALPGSRDAITEFVGGTPCDEPVRRFLGINTAVCQQITWELSLANDAATRPFELRAVYHLPIPGSPNHLDAGTPLRLRGTWTTTNGAGVHKNAPVYSLTIEGRTLRFVLLENNLLHVLTSDSRLMVGNGGWSYTLNRHPATPTEGRRMEPIEPSMHGTESKVLAYRGLAGRFDGRTPCQEISKHLNLAVDAGCTKLKWAVTLFQDPASGRPTTYKLEGTVYRDGRLQGGAPRTGTWSLLRDPSSGSLIYRLDQVEPGGSLFLMRADENVLFFLDKEGNALVGNGSFSYTLNRVASLHP